MVLDKDKEDELKEKKTWRNYDGATYVLIQNHVLDID
jgi:hypothetical protein